MNTDQIPGDIVRMVRAKFSDPSVTRVLELLMLYEGRERDRVLRCILFLSAGDADRVEHNLRRALTDYRDVIYWAEYDRNDNKINDFSKPFDV